MSMESKTIFSLDFIEVKWYKIGPFSDYIQWPMSKNTCHKGKDHCTAAHQVNWIEFDQTSKFVAICMY